MYNSADPVPCQLSPSRVDDHEWLTTLLEDYRTNNRNNNGYPIEISHPDVCLHVLETQILRKGGLPFDSGHSALTDNPHIKQRKVMQNSWRTNKFEVME